MKEKAKRISCYLIVILLTLLIPFTMVLAEVTEKNIEEEADYSEPITTVGSMDDSDGEIPAIGAETDSDGEVPTAMPGTDNNMSTINESVPVPDPGDNPASVDENQIIVQIAIKVMAMAIIITAVVIIKKKNKNA